MLIIRQFEDFKQYGIPAKSFDLTFKSTIFTKSKNLATCRLKVCLGKAHAA